MGRDDVGDERRDEVRAPGQHGRARDTEQIGEYLLHAAADAQGAGDVDQVLHRRPGQDAVCRRQRQQPHEVVLARGVPVPTGPSPAGRAAVVVGVRVVELPARAALIDQGRQRSADCRRRIDIAQHELLLLGGPDHRVELGLVEHDRHRRRHGRQRKRECLRVAKRRADRFEAVGEQEIIEAVGEQVIVGGFQREAQLRGQG